MSVDSQRETQISFPSMQGQNQLQGSFRSCKNPTVHGTITMTPIFANLISGDILCKWNYEGAYRKNIAIHSMMKFTANGSQIMMRKNLLTVDNQILIYLHEDSPGIYSGQYVCINPMDEGVISIPSKPFRQIHGVVEVI